MSTDTTERGLERLICATLTGYPCEPPKAGTVGEPSAGYGGVGWTAPIPTTTTESTASTSSSSRPSCTQPSLRRREALALSEDGPTRRKFLARLQGEISKRGTIDVLRHGIRHGAHEVDLFYGTPSAGNVQAQGAVRAEPLHRHPPAALQPRRDPAGARHRAVHQRPAGLHL